jgi:hypothetical protein
MKNILPPDHYEYMRKVIREGKSVSVKQEVQIMMLLLGRNLFPIILEETTKKDGDEPAYLRKDVTERLKVWNSLANILHQLEKNDESESTAREKPVIEIFARSGIDGDRIKILAGYESSGVGGSPDGTGRAQVESGTISDQLPERPLDLQDSEQVEAIRFLDVDFDRGDSRGVYEA